MSVDPHSGDLRELGINAEVWIAFSIARPDAIGGVVIDVARCEQVIALARAAGHTWSAGEVEQARLDLLAYFAHAAAAATN